MAKKNFVSYGDAETLMSEIADKFDSLPAPTPAPDLSAYETSWTGTKDEWEALDDEEKAKYQIVNITDDSAGGDLAVVDEVTSGNMNPVTSNAVAKHLVSGITRATETIDLSIYSICLVILKNARTTAASVSVYSEYNGNNLDTISGDLSGASFDSSNGTLTLSSHIRYFIIS